MPEYAFRSDLTIGDGPGSSDFAGIWGDQPAELPLGAAWPEAEICRDRLPYLSGRWKRALDMLLVVCMAPLAVILVGLAALAIKLTSRGPALFVQERLGQNGVPFPCYKLRTMIVNAEQGVPCWAVDHDPRITGVGRFLRRTRLDELPQLYNIWRGDMSFVGVRPIRRHFAAILAQKEPLYTVRFLAKPGLTGWDQVNNGYPNTLEDQLRKFRYDLYYLKNASFWLDLRILGKTILVMFKCTGC